MNTYSFFNKPIGVVAHRGDSMHYPENSELAFKSAVDLGVDIIETDVHISSDGVVFIWHDDTSEVLDGSILDISKRPWDELKHLDLGRVFKTDTGEMPFCKTGLGLMSLDYVLKKFPETRFNIDLKDRDDRLVESFLQIIKENKAVNRVIAASFHTENLILLRKLNQEIVTSYGASEVRKLVILSKLRLAGLYLSCWKKRPPVIQIPEQFGKTRVITPYFLDVLFKHGIRVQVWTINNKDDMIRLLSQGIHGIMTDNPRELLHVTRV